ncbi:MAG: hypothetical protein KDE51_18420 [Anaerolineales bacterium]|nr:hypothetical protein [Anaerolineales bacterium]
MRTTLDKILLVIWIAVFIMLPINVYAYRQWSSAVAVYVPPPPIEVEVAEPLPAEVATQVALEAADTPCEETALGRESFYCFQEQNGDEYELVEQGSLRNIRIPVNGIEATFGLSNEWQAFFFPPFAEIIEVGRYANVSRYPALNVTSPAMLVAAEEYNCDELHGWFEVRQLIRLPSGLISRVAIDFEQQCLSPERPPLSGYLRYRSSVPVRE